MKKTSTLIQTALLCALLCGCNLGTATRQTGPGSCGDGQCQPPENAEKCPEDCTGSSDPTAAEKGTAPPSSSGDGSVLYLGIMVHLEHWNDAGDQADFNRHAGYIRQFADLFETHGAKITWESKEVTDGAIRWGDNVLLEMEQRGHGIGVHADIGGQKTYDCSRFAADLRARKQRLESLQVTVRHVSGIVSHCDWVAAAVEAGFLFTTGQVAYSVMSLPIEERPPEYHDCESPVLCHQTFPEDMADRIHPWRMNSGADWLTHDPQGELVMLAASQGMQCMDEELLGHEGKKCFHTLDDNDAFFEYLEQALSLSKPDRVNIYYAWWSLGDPLEETVLEDLFARLEPYIASGRVQWKTLPEVYDAYVIWEQGR